MSPSINPFLHLAHRAQSRCHPVSTPSYTCHIERSRDVTQYQPLPTPVTTSAVEMSIERSRDAPQISKSLFYFLFSMLSFLFSLFYALFSMLFITKLLRHDIAIFSFFNSSSLKRFNFLNLMILSYFFWAR